PESGRACHGPPGRRAGRPPGLLPEPGDSTTERQGSGRRRRIGGASWCGLAREVSQPSYPAPLKLPSRFESKLTPLPFHFTIHQMYTVEYAESVSSDINAL